MTLTDFVLARVEEDIVKRVTMREWHAMDCQEVPYPGSEYTYPCDCGVPERMARECEAKRRIVAGLNAFNVRVNPGLLHNVGGPIAEMILKDLASVYADHPDYREEWAR